MLMPRTITVTIDDSTWPSTGWPPFPPLFHSGSQVETIDMAVVMLVIGFLTTPTINTAVSLSEYWAWVRYFHAIQGVSPLRLTTEFTGLDPHQRTILSDDFGMGLPMYWLQQRLGLQGSCDGRYFIEHYLHATGASHSSSKKSGPSKAPDFVCCDSSGRFHVIECKGTQTGLAYRDSQLFHKPRKKPATGGRVQKRTIRFKKTNGGQRLACGLYIASSGKSNSELKIVDPAIRPLLNVHPKRIDAAQDAIARSSLSRMLRVSGLVTAASVIAFPLGRFFTNAGTLRKRTDSSNLLQYRKANAIAELRSPPTAIGFDGGNAAGREMQIELPRPLRLNGKNFKRVTVRQGMLKHYLPIIESAVDLGQAAWRNLALAVLESGATSNSAWITLGKAYRAEIIFS